RLIPPRGNVRKPRPLNRSRAITPIIGDLIHMSKSASKQKNGNALAHVPTEIYNLLGKPPLLASEDPTRYEALLAALAHDVKPNDFIEWLWIKDTADLTWEIIRYRRINAALIDGRQKEHIESRLDGGRPCSMMDVIEIARRAKEEAPDSNGGGRPKGARL